MTIKKSFIFLIIFFLITGVIVWFNADWFNFVSAAGIDSYTKLLLHNNGVDASKSHAITANGNAQIDTAQSKFGGASGLFDGTGDYLSAPDSDDWNFGSGDWTVDFWMRVPTLEQGGLFEQYVNDSNVAGLRIYGATGELWFSLYSGGSLLADFGTAASAISANVWMHIAFVHSGTTYKIYIDGIEKASLTDTDNWGNYAAPLVIGYYALAGAPGYFNGWIDELRVSKGLARWTANFTPPGRQYISDSSTALLLHLNGTDAATAIDDASGGDESGNNKIITYNGDAQLDTAQSKFGGASGLFDGTGDYASTSDSADWNFGAGSFTIDTWVRWNALPADGAYQAIVAQWDDSGAGGNLNWNVQFTRSGANYNIYFGWSTTGVNDLGTTFAFPSPLINTWYHIAVVRSGTSIYVFVDGTQIGSTYNIGTATFYDSTKLLTIGAVKDSGVNFFNGWLDELRVSKGIARWTANFTPPASAYSTLKRLIIY